MRHGKIECEGCQNGAALRRQHRHEMRRNDQRGAACDDAKNPGDHERSVVPPAQPAAGLGRKSDEGIHRIGARHCHHQCGGAREIGPKAINRKHELRLAPPPGPTTRMLRTSTSVRHDIGPPMGYHGLSMSREPPTFLLGPRGGNRDDTKAMTAEQHASEGRHNVASSLHRRPAGSAAAGLSIVVPVYNEAAGLAQLHARITAIAAALRNERGLACEIVYVDDGSRDASLDVAQGLPADAADLQVVSLSRNFGKEAALLAGLDHASRGAVLFMDADGQHPPALIEKLVGHWLDGGYDVVYTAKAHRENEPRLLRVAVKGFYSLINWGARQKIPEDAGDFRLLSPRAAAALRQMPERNRFFKGLASWIGKKRLRSGIWR